MTVIEDVQLKQFQSQMKTDNGDFMTITQWIKLKLFFEERARCLLNYLIKLLNYD